MMYTYDLSVEILQTMMAINRREKNKIMNKIVLCDWW